jgi:hypothetical protein
MKIPTDTDLQTHNLAVAELAKRGFIVKSVTNEREDAIAPKCFMARNDCGCAEVDSRGFVNGLTLLDFFAEFVA